MTKSILAAFAAAAFLASPATAQTWDGAYVGAQIGYGSGKSDTESELGGQWSIETVLRDHVTDFTSANSDPKGLTYGIQAGYNFHASSDVVLGGEVDFALLNVDGSRTDGPTPVPEVPSLSYTAGNSVDAKHMLSLRARAGYAFGRSLLYLHGGMAWLKAEYQTELSSSGNYRKAGSRTKTTNGFIVGAGFEQMLGESLSGRLEYSYTDQGRVRSENIYLPGSTFTSPAYTETYRHDLKLHLIRVGLNLHF